MNNLNMMLSKELIGGQPHANCRKSANIQQQKLNYDEILEAVMRKRDITNDLIFSYTAVLINLRALDISFNKLTSLPIDMPKKLVALNLSFNSISHLQIKSQPTFQLIELQLTHNGLERISGLEYLLTLEYVDISHNNLKFIHGFEPLIHLKTLMLSNNTIASISSLRCLSFNKALETLDLSNNPVAQHKDYRCTIRNACPSLEVLDSKAFQTGSKTSKKTSSSAVGVSSSSTSNTTPVNASSSSSSSSQISKVPVSIGYEQMYTSSKNTSKTTTPSSSSQSHRSELSKDHLNISQSFLELKNPIIFPIEDNNRKKVKSALPWRRPPNPIPRHMIGIQTNERASLNPSHPHNSNATNQNDSLHSKNIPSSKIKPQQPYPLRRSLEEQTSYLRRKNGASFVEDESDKPTKWMTPNIAVLLDPSALQETKQSIEEGKGPSPENRNRSRRSSTTVETHQAFTVSPEKSVNSYLAEYNNIQNHNVGNRSYAFDSNAEYDENHSDVEEDDLEGYSRQYNSNSRTSHIRDNRYSEDPQDSSPYTDSSPQISRSTDISDELYLSPPPPPQGQGTPLGSSLRSSTMRLLQETKSSALRAAHTRAVMEQKKLKEEEEEHLIEIWQNRRRSNSTSSTISTKSTAANRMSPSGKSEFDALHTSRGGSAYSILKRLQAMIVDDGEDKLEDDNLLNSVRNLSEAVQESKVSNGAYSNSESSPNNNAINNSGYNITQRETNQSTSRNIFNSSNIANKSNAGVINSSPTLSKSPSTPSPPKLRPTKSTGVPSLLKASYEYEMQQRQRTIADPISSTMDIPPPPFLQSIVGASRGDNELVDYSSSTYLNSTNTVIDESEANDDNNSLPSFASSLTYPTFTTTAVTIGEPSTESSKLNRALEALMKRKQETLEMLHRAKASAASSVTS